MFQQFFALIIIVFFLIRLLRQKQKDKIGNLEFLFWLFFWLMAGLAIVFIKKIDVLTAQLGFSGRGIEVLLYLAVVGLFYLVFRLRLKIEKIERDITKLVREIAIKQKDNL